MQITQTVTFEIEDIPEDLVHAVLPYHGKIVCACRFDGGAYRLRLWPESIPKEVDDTANDVLCEEAFDGVSNWGTLGVDRLQAAKLLIQYVAHQKTLYPGIELIIDLGEGAPP